MAFSTNLLPCPCTLDLSMPQPTVRDFGVILDTSDEEPDTLACPPVFGLSQDPL